MLAWQNRSNEALELYRKILARDSQNAAALRGEAEILNWKGHFVEARALAQQAKAKEPSDERARLELARADIGLKKFTEARDAIAGLSEPAIPGINDARQEEPDLSSYIDPEIVTRIRKRHHAGLIVRSADPLRRTKHERTQRSKESPAGPEVRRKAASARHACRAGDGWGDCLRPAVQ